MLMHVARVLLGSLLSMYPPPADVRARLEAHESEIVAHASASAEHYHIPPSVLITVGFLETHLGVDRGEGGNWGSPIDRRHRHVAGTADSAARDLARSFHVCGTWLGALRRYRSGLCDREPQRGYTAAFALRIVERMHRRAGVPLPERLR